MIKNYYIAADFDYDIALLKSGWAKKNFQIENDSLVSFQGIYKHSPKIKPLDHQDSQPFFNSQKLLNFVIEHRRIHLREMLLRRHIFFEIICKTLGNDSKIIDNTIMLNKHRLSTTHIASNLRASMCHIGFLLRNDQENPQLLALDQLDINPKNFAITVMQKYCKSMNDICKKT